MGVAVSPPQFRCLDARPALSQAQAPKRFKRTLLRPPRCGHIGRRPLVWAR